MKFILNILEKLKLKDERIFLGSYEDWEIALKRVKDPTHIRIGTHEYAFAPLMSMGTMSLNHSNIPIGVRLKITEINNEKLHLQFTAPVRPEFFFIFAFFLITIIVVFCTLGLSTPLYILLVCWPVFQFWFHFILRAQEEAVIEILTKEIRLYKLRK